MDGVKNLVPIKPMSHREAEASLQIVSEAVEQVETWRQTAGAELIRFDERKGWQALNYKTLADCLGARLGIEKSYSYYLLADARTRQNLLESAEEEQKEMVEAASERALRPLTKLKPEEQRKAFEEALKLASVDGEEQVSSRHTSEAVQHLQGLTANSTVVESALVTCPLCRGKGEIKPSAAEKAGEKVPLPKELDTDPFRTVWKEWLEYRRKEKKKAVTPMSASKALKELAEMGPERAAAAIEHSIANGWQGIFEANGSNKKQRDRTI